MDIIFLTIVAILIIIVAKMVYDYHQAKGESGARHSSVLMGLCGTILVLLGLGAESEGWNLLHIYGLGIVASAAMVAAIGWTRAHSTSGRHSLG